MGSPTLRSNRLRQLLSANVRSLLEEHEWSENELARRSGVSQKQVNNISVARTGCGIDALDYLAKALKVESWQLLLPGLGKVRGNTSRPARILHAYVAMGRAEQDSLARHVLGDGAK